MPTGGVARAVRIGPFMTTNAWHPDEDPQSSVDPRVDNEAVEIPADEMGMNPDAQPGIPDEATSPAEGGD